MAEAESACAEPASAAHVSATHASAAHAALVTLECVLEGKKLRVKMRTPGYLVGSNCQFPQALRMEGRIYTVPAIHVKLMNQHGKYFYSIRKGITFQDADGMTHTQETSFGAAATTSVCKKITIFEDETSCECAVCLDQEKNTVFIPCGHFYTCINCAKALQSCPICRQVIKDRVNKAQFD
jgi:hypothetical protein